MSVIWHLPQTAAIFNRFGGINGSAYLIGGFGMTALTGRIPSRAVGKLNPPEIGDA